MVTLTKIYTRGGDKGQTSLGTGARIAKHDLRVESYGTVDEANAVIGLVRLHTSEDETVDSMLSRIQNDLFDLGADLCTPQETQRKATALRITEAQITRLENEIDALNADLQPLTSFVLPGGTPASAYLHQARCVVRRAERLTTQLAEREDLNPAVISYINRLSDHLFVLARHVNDQGAKDVLWQPGANLES
ncbi:MAG: cob(I)yrinic acid a,c-diamide adenosyltransferase [Rhodospirillales bacterium]|jgi:cob(I)alamin adenosyltransferase|nr:cob(I)yrinic acid a,c-diamide adenosyltransferase [Rhodospirillales bacterium]